MPTIADIYAQELQCRGYGHPMWYPEGSKTGEPQIGDVGYILDGAFFRLLNVLEPKDSPRYKNGPPENYVPLEYDKDEFDDHRDAALQSRAFSSQSVKHVKVEGAVQVDANIAGGGVGYRYTCTHQRGALLLMTEDAKQRVVAPNNIFSTYMKKHHGEWMKWLTAKGYSLKPEQIIMIRGTVNTTEWTVAAFQSQESGHAVNIEGTFVSAGSIGFELSRDTANDGSVEYRSGPEAARRSPSPARSLVPLDSATALTPNHGLYATHSRGDSRSSLSHSEKKWNQCVFLPYYRIKYRLFVLRRIQAAAGYDELPDPEKDDSYTRITVETEGQGNNDPDAPAEFAGDPLDIVLDYILQYSDAEVAVACEGDINALLLDAPWPEDLRAWLEDNKPDIDVDDSMGTLSLVKAIQAGRRHLLHKAANTPVEIPTPDGGDDAGDQDVDVDMDLGGLDNLGGPGDASGEAKNITGEGKLLLAKRLPEISLIDWPHMELVDEEAETGAVSSMSLSPEGSYLATGSDDSNVRLWDLRTGRLRRKWEGHEDIIWSVSYAPDGSRIASASADSAIILWDPENANEEDEIGRLEGHSADVWTVVHSSDSKKLASGSVDNTVRIWDLGTRETLHVLRGHTSQVMHVAFTPDGSRIVSCADTMGRIWDVESGRELAILRGHAGAIWSMALSKAGDRIITGSEDHSSRIWDSTTGDELVTLNEHTGPIWAVSFSPDDKEVVTGSYDSTLVTNDSLSGERHQVFADRPSIVDSVAYSKNGNYIISGSADGNVKLWDRPSGKLIAEYRGHGDKVKNVMFSRDNRDLLSCSDDGSVRMWSVRDALRLS